MERMRAVKSVVPTHTVLEGGGFKVRRPAAMGMLMSPFLLLDEMGPVDYGPGELSVLHGTHIEDLRQ